ncbi:hypothetical protein LJC28_02915 [Dysgonomonas sp. OttesenSCG-928-D17]|nr:hypothetical protein [Dysgonomonas sp. OttesenSCG-928-D17]
MKKMILVVVLATVCLFANAQDGLKGTWFAGGEISYSDVSDVKSTMVLPIAGTFVSPDVAVGLGVGYMSVKENGVTDDAFVVKPLVRKYWNITGPLYLFGQAAAPMIFGDNTQLGLQLSPGLDFVVTSWMTIETSFTIFGVNYIDYDGGGSDFSIGANPFNSIADREVGTLQVGVKFLF